MLVEKINRYDYPFRVLSVSNCLSWDSKVTGNKEQNCGDTISCSHMPDPSVFFQKWKRTEPSGLCALGHVRSNSHICFFHDSLQTSHMVNKWVVLSLSQSSGTPVVLELHFNSKAPKKLFLHKDIKDRMNGWLRSVTQYEQKSKLNELGYSLAIYFWNNKYNSLTVIRGKKNYAHP